MTKELFLKLEPYESYFETATKARYVRSILNKDLDVLKEVGEQLGIKLTNSHCSACILAFMRNLGGKYYEKQQEISSAANSRRKKKDSTSEDS